LNKIDFAPLSLTCTDSGVYIAALPGKKKAAGVCRTKRGNYGRAVIETNYFDIANPNGSLPRQPSTPDNAKDNPATGRYTV